MAFPLAFTTIYEGKEFTKLILSVFIAATALSQICFAEFYSFACFGDEKQHSAEGPERITDEELRHQRRGSALSGFRPRAASSDIFKSDGSNTLTNGAQELWVGEPLIPLFIEFDEVAEARFLTPQELAALVKSYGSTRKAGIAIELASRSYFKMRPDSNV